MPSRNKRKLKRQLRQERSTNQDDLFEATTLEKDLRQQRIRQQERQKREANKIQPPSENVEEEVPYFKQRQIQRQDLMLKGMATICEESLVALPSLNFCFVNNESPLLSPRQKNRIRNIWHSKYLFENMHVNPKASLLYGSKLKWRNHSLPDGMYAPVDMTCKHHLHPSARTFDVAALEKGKLPTIATAVQGGLGIFSPPHHGIRRDRFHTLRGLPVYSVRIHESGRCGAVVKSNGRFSTYKFQCYSLPRTDSYFEVPLHEPVTDFTFGTDLVLFACPRYFESETLSPILLTLEDGREGSLRTLNVQNFPQSDAMTVEMTCNEDKYVAFGHRNGQVSLLDLRQSHTCCSILQYMDNASSPLGSATDISFLNNKEMVVKRSFGSSQLHDLRRISSSPSNASQVIQNSSLVYNLIAPSQDILPTMSATCSGLAVDPTCQQTLITPYINSSHEACLGLWSLRTGVFVGEKVLAKKSGDDTIFVEVCQNTTASFLHATKYDSSRFGVWLKCGRFSKSNLNGKGSLHHLTFLGSSKS